MQTKITLQQVISGRVQILTSDDVRTFIQWCVQDQHLAFHPDTLFGDYIIDSTSEPFYSIEQAGFLDRILEEAFDLCRQQDIDIYEIAFDELKKLGNSHMLNAFARLGSFERSA